MSSGLAGYSYDSEGRLVAVNFPDGANVQYSYDLMGNRTTVVETGPTQPSCSPPTVSSLPKPPQGDFINPAMIVLLSNGNLAGWGSNGTGVLCNGGSSATNAPAQHLLFDPDTPMPPFNATIVDWAFTNANVYVVYSNGWVYSGGNNAYGQLGHGDTTTRPFLKRIEYFQQNYLSITKVWACGTWDTTAGGGCVYFQASDFSMYACGENGAGNLGNATTPTSNIYTPAPCTGISYSPTSYVADIAISAVNTSFSAYMLYNTGQLFVAGYNGQGQLGVNSTTNVTGSFQPAKTASGPVTNFASIVVNAGFYTNGTTNYYGGNAIAIDTIGNGWVVGSNNYYELGLGSTTGQLQFVQNTNLANVTQAGIGGGYFSYAYALTSNGTLLTWGYNGRDNLFQNNTADPTIPTAANYTPGTISKILMPKGNELSTYSQLIVLTSNGLIAYAGLGNGQVGIPSSVYPNAFSFVATPASILNGVETVIDLFVHGHITVQRWFILTNLGNLYACGDNSGSICTGGVSNDVRAANVEWQKISFA